MYHIKNDSLDPNDLWEAMKETYMNRFDQPLLLLVPLQDEAHAMFFRNLRGCFGFYLFNGRLVMVFFVVMTVVVFFMVYQGASQHSFRCNTGHDGEGRRLPS